MRAVLAALAVLAACFPAEAADITISLSEEGTEVQRSEAVYTCGDRQIPVEYINAGSVSLAVLEIDEATIVASNVISGSGAKYAGAQYVWWTKGDEASLFDLMEGEDAPPTACTSE